MSTELQIQLKEAGTGGNTFNLAEDEIIRVMSDTLGALVTYYKEGARIRNVIVVETPAQIALLCKTLIPVTHTDSNVEHINASHIIIIDDSGDNTVIKYDAKGVIPIEITVTETKGAINKAIYELAGQTTYVIDITNLTTNSFTLEAAHGDKTTTFTADSVFSVIDSTGNDGTYTVASRSYGGGKTTIVVTETISNGVDDGEILIVV